MTQAAEAVTMAAEEESRQRRSLVGEYAASLAHQLELLHQDLCARQDQWASFCSALMEAQWLLKASASSSPEESPQPGQSPEEYVPGEPESERGIQTRETECIASRSPRSSHIKSFSISPCLCPLISLPYPVSLQGDFSAGHSAGPLVPGHAARRPPLEGLGLPGHWHRGRAAADR